MFDTSEVPRPLLIQIPFATPTGSFSNDGSITTCVGDGMHVLLDELVVQDVIVEVNTDWTVIVGKIVVTAAI